MNIHELRLVIPHREAGPAIVRRTAHRWSGRYSVSVLDEAETSVVRLRGDMGLPEQIEREFRAALLDDTLRQRVESETAGLRQVIVEAALRSALRDPETRP